MPVLDVSQSETSAQIARPTNAWPTRRRDEPPLRHSAAVTARPHKHDVQIANQRAGPVNVVTIFVGPFPLLSPAPNALHGVAMCTMRANIDRGARLCTVS